MIKKDPFTNSAKKISVVLPSVSLTGNVPVVGSLGAEYNI